MYSIKPGRGPSTAGAIGGVFAAIFGVIWTIGAMSIGAPPFFALFGVFFVVAAIGGVIYNAYNAASRNRMSTFDITTPGEEQDPIERAMFGADSSSRYTTTQEPKRKIVGDFCPYCGNEVQADFDFCPNCGKDI